MATIRRGWNFQPTDILQAFSLNQLVKNASITGLSLSDLAGSQVAQISVFSAPSGVPTGWVSAQYEKPLVSTAASYSEFNYVLQTDAGPVALFKPGGLETKRFAFLEQNNTLPGSCITIKDLGAASVTLVSGIGVVGAGVNIHAWVGANPFTANTGVSNVPRLVFRGLAPIRVTDGDTAPRHYYGRKAVGIDAWEAQPQLANSTKLAALGLEPSVSAAWVAPAWFFGGIVNRV